VHHIDKQPKEAAIFLLRIIACHDHRARSAEDKNREESLRYHGASRADAEELLAIYEKRWPKEAAVGRSKYAAAKAAEAGNYPSQGAMGVMADAEKGGSAERRLRPSLRRAVPPLEPDATGNRLRPL